MEFFRRSELAPFCSDKIKKQKFERSKTKIPKIATTRVISSVSSH